MIMFSIVLFMESWLALWMSLGVLSLNHPHKRESRAVSHLTNLARVRVISTVQYNSTVLVTGIKNKWYYINKTFYLFNSMATSLCLINLIFPHFFLCLRQKSWTMISRRWKIWKNTYGPSLQRIWLGYEKLNTTTQLVHKDISQILCGCYILKQIIIEHHLNTRFPCKKYIKLQCIIIIKILWGLKLTYKSSEK